MSSTDCNSVAVNFLGGNKENVSTVGVINKGQTVGSMNADCIYNGIAIVRLSRWSLVTL